MQGERLDFPVRVPPREPQRAHGVGVGEQEEIALGELLHAIARARSHEDVLCLRRDERFFDRALLMIVRRSNAWVWHGGSYFDEDRVETRFGDSGTTNSHRRMTMQTFLGELLDAGFVLERFVEPRATEAARQVDESRAQSRLVGDFPEGSVSSACLIRSSGMPAALPAWMSATRRSVTPGYRR